MCEIDLFFKANNIGGNDEVHRLQFTELKDRNGKDIYEKDLIKRNAVYLVIFDDSEASFALDRVNDRTKFPISRYDSTADYEVIGNIYENPELLQ